MKAIFAFFLIVLFGSLASIFLPWWVISIVCFLVGMAFLDSGWQAILVGFFSVLLIWSVAALYQSYINDFILLDRMGKLLDVPSPYLVIVITSILGGLIGMLSTLSGYYLQTINEKRKPKNQYYH
jgi:hypothetical protein